MSDSMLATNRATWLVSRAPASREREYLLCPEADRGGIWPADSGANVIVECCTRRRPKGEEAGKVYRVFCCGAGAKAE